MLVGRVVATTSPRAHFIAGGGGPGAEAPPQPLHPPRLLHSAPRNRAARSAVNWAERTWPRRAGRIIPLSPLASVRTALMAPLVPDHEEGLCAVTHRAPQAHCWPFPISPGSSKLWSPCPCYWNPGPVT